MAKRISGSVGKGGKNNSEDTQVVQELLNGFSKKCGFKKLDTDGLIGPKTIAAIAEFQKTAVGMSRADSRVDSGGKSFATLAAGPKKAEAEAKKAEKANAENAEKEKKAKSGKAEGKGKPQVKGDTRGVDKRILGVLEAVSSHYGKPIVVESGKQTPKGSSAGEYLWREWLNKLDRGVRDPILKRDKVLRQNLDQLYNQVKKDEFVALAEKGLKKKKKTKGGGSDAHAAGRAVDIKRNTDSKVVAALATILRQEDEGNVIHFDDTGKSVPKTINEAITAKWK